MSVDGGGLVEGQNLAYHRRSRCTSGFVVTNGEMNAITTAAHCPDQLTYIDLRRQQHELDVPMIGSWGLAIATCRSTAARIRPIHFSTPTAAPVRCAKLRPGEMFASTRAGDFVCHYGESSGYSCATVELTDYAPPGELCGGPCSPTWVTVRGPSCIPGDSGGPVFSGDVAFGIAKGINRDEAGRCLFYYYMSTDYLPPPWRVLTAGDLSPLRSGRP